MSLKQALSMLPAPSGELGMQLGTGSSTQDWRRALHAVVPAVVVLKVTQNRSLDTEVAGTSYATGFIVDRQRGLILTNRHVAFPGPLTASAIFLNHEEVPVQQLYNDPVHDFGFFRFDVKALQYMALSEVPLHADGASVGLEVRVVGNDSGEKVSILAGTLARLDRDAPHYGTGKYCDFNIFYIQAASGTKGGSSGSPVIDAQGNAVALNAGGRSKASSAFYLPLHRIVRALHLLQDCWLPGDQPAWRAPCVPRGDLLATFLFKGYDEARRLGLSQPAEAIVRDAAAAAGAQQGGPTGGSNSGATGLLAVDSVVPQGAADGLLEPGDLLLTVNGQVITHFQPLEALLDDAVGRLVRLELERAGKLVKVDVQVHDLHAVTPDCFLEAGGAVLHALSYQQARNYRAPMGSVYVADAGYLLGRARVPKHAVITSLAGRPTPDLEAFARALRSRQPGTAAALQFRTFNERHRVKSAILQIDHRWYGGPVFWQQDRAAGTWRPVQDWPRGAEPAPASDGAGAVRSAADALDLGAEEPTLQQGQDEALEAQLRSSLVIVEVEVPLIGLVDGVHAHSFAGSGIVLQHTAEQGLVAVDRNTVTMALADITLSFGAHPAEAPARVRFLHPLHNFALLSYNPQDLPPKARALVKEAPLSLSPLRRGDAVRLVGLTKDLRIMHRRSVVTNACSCTRIPHAEVPRFRAVHEEVIKVDQAFGDAFSGVLADDQGAILALWASYSEQRADREHEWCAGMPAAVIAPWLEKVAALGREGRPPDVRVLGAEMEPLALSKAAKFGLPRPWVERLVVADQERRQVLRVQGREAGCHAAEVLQDGDLLLAIAGRPVTNFRDLEDAIASYKGAVTAPRAPGHPPLEDRSADWSNCVPQKRPRSSAGSSAAKRTCGERAGPASPCSPHVSGTDPAEPSISSADPAGQPVAAGVQRGSATADGGAAALQQLPQLPLTILRDGAIQEAAVRVSLHPGLGTTTRVVHWCGAQLQAPHRAVKVAGSLPAGGCGVFVSRWHHGSPAHRYGLYALHFIQELNSTPTPDLEAFIAAASGLQDGDYVRLRLVHLETTRPKVLSLRMDLRYWPTWQLLLDPQTGSWNRYVISQLPAAKL